MTKMMIAIDEFKYLPPEKMKTSQRTILSASPACFVFVLMILTSFCRQVGAAPPKGHNWIPFAPMTDDFNGANLDTNKWYSNNPHWHGRAPVFFDKNCVSVSGGLLRISALNSTESAKHFMPKGFTHVSGFVMSKSLARFGYFEIRAKLADTTLDSCFWLSQRTPEEWSEIDVVEVPAGIEKYQNTIRPNTHYFYGPYYHGTRYHHLANPSKTELPFKMADGFHVYGLEWTPNHLRWYVDGKLIRVSRNRHFFQPLHMNVDLEASSFFGALPEDARLPATYEVDWVRSWRLAFK